MIHVTDYDMELVVKGKFGEWISNRMREFGLTEKDLYKITHQGLTWPKVARHLTGITKPKFASVCMYAYCLECDPEDLWKLVEEDWG